LRGASQGKNTERTKWGAPWRVCHDGGRKGSTVAILRCWWLDVAIRPAQHPVIQLYNNKETKFRENRLPRRRQPKSSRESADFALFSRARLKFFLVSSPEL